MKRIIYIIACCYLLPLHAQDINFYELLNKTSTKNGPKNITMPGITSCYVDPLIYPINYTANGYICNKTPAEVEILKKQNIDFLNSIYQSVVFTDSFKLALAKKLMIREMSFDKDVPYYDYDEFNIPNNNDTTAIFSFLAELKNLNYIRLPFNYFSYEDKNSKIDEHYKKIILSKNLNQNNLSALLDEILKCTTVRDVFNRTIQYYDFCYKNNYEPNKMKDGIKVIYYNALQLHDSLLIKTEILNNIASTYYNMGERQLSYKTLLYALESSKYRAESNKYFFDDNFNTIRLLKKLYYHPDVSNYYIDNRYYQHLIDFQQLCYKTGNNYYTVPIYTYNYITKRHDAKWNYSLLIERGIAEYKLLNYYKITLPADSIRTYASILIVNQLIEQYKAAQRDSFTIDNDIMADLNYVFSNYVYKYSNNINDMYFGFSFRNLEYSLDNFEYNQYQNRFFSFIENLKYRKLDSTAYYFTTSLGALPDVLNDYRLDARLLYYLADNYIQKKQLDSVELVRQAITERRNNNINGSYYYNREFAQIDKLLAAHNKDTVKEFEAKLYLAQNYEVLPIKDAYDFATTEYEYMREQSYSKLRSINDSLNKANIELEDKKVELTLAKQIAEASEKEAKKQERIAVDRLKDNIAKDSIIQKQIKQLKNDSIRLEDEIVLKENALSDALRQKGIAEGNATDAIRNKWIAYILGGIAGILFLAAGVFALLYYLKNKKLNEVTIKQLEAENNRQKAEANLAHKLLTMHNFKGLDVVKSRLYRYKEKNNDAVITECYDILKDTYLYMQNSLINLQDGTVRLRKEFDTIELFFKTLKVAKGKEYQLILPSNDEIDKYGNYKIISNSLQPIIENVIDYSGIEQNGVNGKEGIIKISITEENNNCIKLNINDNGISNHDKSNRIEKKKGSTGLSLKLISETFEKYTFNSKIIMKFDVKTDLEINNKGNNNCNFFIYNYD
jgi:hypothetical protein